MKINQSENTWTLVYDVNGNVIVKNPPGLYTGTPDSNILIEFPTEEEMNKYIQDNKLTDSEEQ
jgi:hypothetical protein